MIKHGSLKTTHNGSSSLQFSMGGISRSCTLAAALYVLSYQHFLEISPKVHLQLIVSNIINSPTEYRQELLCITKGKVISQVPPQSIAQCKTLFWCQWVFLHFSNMELHKELYTMYFTWSIVDKLSFLLWVKGIPHLTDYCSKSKFPKSRLRESPALIVQNTKMNNRYNTKKLHLLTVHVNRDMQLSHNRYKSKQKQTNKKIITYFNRFIPAVFSF